MRISTGLLIIGGVGAAFLAGSWDNLNSFDRTVEHGHQTAARISGISAARSGFPVTFDGYWRPRLLENSTLLHLEWRGADGEIRSRRNVPVTDDFARRLLVAGKIKRANIPIKVLEGMTSVPVVQEDAVARRASIVDFSRLGFIVFGSALSGLGAIALASLVTAGLRRERTLPHFSAFLRRQFPIKGAVLSGFLLFSGSLLLLGAWKEHKSASVLASEGLDAEAQIVDAYAGSTGTSISVSNSLIVSWTDSSGAARQFGPWPISEALYRAIQQGQRIVAIRYVPNNNSVRPTIVGEDPSKAGDKKLILLGGVLAVAGMLGSAWCIRRTKRG